MAKAVVTFKIMPESVEVDLDVVKSNAEGLVKEFAGEGDTKVTIEPVAFGLKCIKYIFVMEESLGSPDTLAEKIEALEGVQSVEVTDVRRALG